LGFNKNILIVEDEVLIAQHLKISIVKHGYNCAGIAIDYRGAVEILKTEKVDIIFLDVRISGNKTGLDLAELINEKYGIPFLFITSFNDAETLEKIKKLSPKAYINKPINEFTLLTTIDIIFNNMKSEETSYMNFNVGTATYNINLSDLLYLSSEHVYVRLNYKERSLLVRSSLKYLIEQMPEDNFVRINRSTAINLNHVRIFNTNYVFINDMQLKISQKYKEEVAGILNKNN
jgi:DNA-binding LytR/AlgR family response regulator